MAKGNQFYGIIILNI